MKKLIPLIIALSAFSISSVMAQTAASSPTPGASPSPAKHKHSKKAAATAVTAAGSPGASASPSPGKHSWLKKIKAAAAAGGSPAAATSSPASAQASKTTIAPTASTTPAPGGGPGMVWVNTNSHVYHKEGSKWYGKTKHGKYMTEQDAIKEGDHADPKEGSK